MLPILPAALAVLGACGGERAPNPVKEALARTPRAREIGAPVTFRFPAAGPGDVKLYRLPRLEEAAWRFEGGDHPARAVVGFAGDDDLVYTVTGPRQLLALDLATGRARVVDTAVALATLGPTGTPYVVYADGSAATVQQRAPLRWSHPFSTPPLAVWGAVRHRLLALVTHDGERRLELLAEGAAPVGQELPAGEVAVTWWGDRVAVAADSGIVTIDPGGTAPRGFVRLRPAPQLVAFSPSGHRLYAATASELLALDRFDLAVLHRLPLPGPVSALRPDPRGQLLLLRHATADTTWVVTVARWALVGALAGEWTDDLPAAAPDGTILVRREGVVRAIVPDGLEETGRADDPDDDLWLVAAWDPRRPAIELASATTAAEQPQASVTYWVQVASTINQAWAEERAADLRRAGILAGVLAPELSDEPYRVVIGPYPTHEDAQGIGHKLGLPFWVFSRDTSSAIP